MTPEAVFFDACGTRSVACSVGLLAAPMCPRGGGRPAVPGRERQIGCIRSMTCSAADGSRWTPPPKSSR